MQIMKKLIIIACLIFFILGMLSIEEYKVKKLEFEGTVYAKKIAFQALMVFGKSYRLPKYIVRYYIYVKTQDGKQVVVTITDERDYKEIRNNAKARKLPHELILRYQNPYDTKPERLTRIRARSFLGF